VPDELTAATEQRFPESERAIGPVFPDPFRENRPSAFSFDEITTGLDGPFVRERFTPAAIRRKT